MPTFTCPKCGHTSNQPKPVTSMSHVCPVDNVDREMKRSKQ